MTKGCTEIKFKKLNFVFAIFKFKVMMLLSLDMAKNKIYLSAGFSVYFA